MTENLFWCLPSSYSPTHFSNKSQTEHRNIFLLFDSPLFIAVPFYTPHSMPSCDCRRLFLIKYAQAKTKSQYIMDLEKIISNINGSKLLPPLTITSYILNHILRIHHWRCSSFSSALPDVNGVNVLTSSCHITLFPPPLYSNWLQKCQFSHTLCHMFRMHYVWNYFEIVSTN